MLTADIYWVSTVLTALSSLPAQSSKPCMSDIISNKVLKPGKFRLKKVKKKNLPKFKKLVSEGIALEIFCFHIKFVFLTSLICLLSEEKMIGFPPMHQ